MGRLSTSVNTGATSGGSSGLFIGQEHAVSISMKGVPGVQELLKELHKYYDSDNRKYKVLKKGGEVFKSAARMKVPVGRGTHFRYRKGGSRIKYNSGNLRDSIVILNEKKSKLRNVKSTVYVGPNFGGRPDGYYARWVEYPTDPRKKRRPMGQPFMRPAWDNNHVRVNRLVRHELKKLLEEFKRAKNVA